MAVAAVRYLWTPPPPLVLHGSVVPLQDAQMANQGWSFIRSNRVFVLRDYVRRLVRLQLSSRVCSLLHHALIRSNLFQNCSSAKKNREKNHFLLGTSFNFFFFLASVSVLNLLFCAPLHHIHSKALKYNKMRSSAFHLIFYLWDKNIKIGIKISQPFVRSTDVSRSWKVCG